MPLLTQKNTAFLFLHFFYLLQTRELSLSPFKYPPHPIDALEAHIGVIAARRVDMAVSFHRRNLFNNARSLLEIGSLDEIECHDGTFLPVDNDPFAVT